MSRILIVEDARLMRDTLVDVLEAAGHVTVTAENGRQALEILASGGGFDAVVTDIIMPEMDGIEAILEIQSLQPDARIVAISGGSARTDKAQGLETAKRLGAAAVIEKPFEVDVLLKTLEKVLG